MKRLLYLPLLFLFSCTNNSTQKLPSIAGLGESDLKNSSEITCWGIGEIELEDSYAILVEKVGAKNLKQDSLFEEGVFQGMVTSIWKGNAKEIVVHWKEKKAPFITIEALEIAHPSSVYHFINGIRIGTTLSELVKLNGGKDFSLWGFGWDHGGRIKDFDNGSLSGDLPCFNGVLALPDAAIKEKELMGDRLIQASTILLTTYDPALVNIQVKNVG
ncbi:hypothetical protein ADIARSV_2004 [Arcticibacter svalbardensis MN12-7]|uniref:Uncharacterized protein n=1 Tax=Arcticibacter svalbardensis MN12-7 TaxID=1150600 RepID=R9GSY0_9SPHI|nr:hypothetical protein [Arcticibacter svalbardensis]EOR94788.1 hypothetical protein ADIARSV_2004 [Arcticibacter svalbardensis MN12-7]